MIIAQDGGLYADIIMDKPILTVIQSMQQSYEESLEFIENGDKQGFIDCLIE